MKQLTEKMQMDHRAILENKDQEIQAKSKQIEQLQSEVLSSRQLSYSKEQDEKRS